MTAESLIKVIILSIKLTHYINKILYILIQAKLTALLQAEINLKLK